MVTIDQRGVSCLTVTLVSHRLVHPPQDTFAAYRIRSNDQAWLKDPADGLHIQIVNPLISRLVWRQTRALSRPGLLLLRYDLMLRSVSEQFECNLRIVDNDDRLSEYSH